MFDWIKQPLHYTQIAHNLIKPQNQSQRQKVMKMKLSALSLAIHPANVPEKYFLIFPEGQIKAKDGRPFEVPAWVMQKDNGVALANALNVSSKDVVIDYEHQTILSNKMDKLHQPQDS